MFQSAPALKRRENLGAKVTWYITVQFQSAPALKRRENRHPGAPERLRDIVSIRSRLKKAGERSINSFSMHSSRFQSAPALKRRENNQDFPT